MIKAHDYVLVLQDKKLQGSGLKRGDELYVIKTEQLPEKRHDPYLFRTYVVVLTLDENGLPQFPNGATGDEDNGYRAYRVDPRNLAKVSDERTKTLVKKLEEAYGETAN